MNNKGIFLTLFLLRLQAALVLGDVQGDVQQILDGNTKVFLSRNHPKAQGLNIKITYPINWKAKEGNRPHIVQNLVNPDSDAMVILQVRNIPSPFTDNDFLDALKESLDNGEPTDLTPPNATLSSQTLSKIDGEECIIMEYQYTGERLGLKIPTYGYTVAIPYSNKLLMFMGMVSGIGLSPTEIREKYEKHKPLIMLITGSLVISEKWTANDSRYSVSYAIGLAIFPALLWSILVLVCLNLFKNRQPTFLNFIYSYIATVTVLACLFLVARDGVSGLVNFGAIAALPISIVVFYLNKRTLQTQQTLPEDTQPFPDETTQTDSTKKGISELKGYFSDLKDNKVDPPDPPPLLVDEPKKKKSKFAGNVLSLLGTIVVLLIASGIGKLIGNLAGKKAAESVLESKPRPSIPKPKELKPYNVAGIHLLAPQKFTTLNLTSTEVDQLIKSGILKSVESYTSKSSGFHIGVSMSEYALNTPLSLEGAMEGSLQQMLPKLKMTDHTREVEHISISNQPAFLAKINGKSILGQTMIHGVYFSKGNKLWGVIINGYESRQNTALAKKIIDSISINPTAKVKVPSISIHLAADAGHIEAVKQHLADGVDVNMKDEEGATPLHYALNKEIAELLIAKGADMNAKDDEGWTPLFFAANSGHKEIAELLIVAKGADMNAKEGEIGGTPLHFAAWKGHNEIAELLIANGADVNVKTFKGGTPLFYAANSGHKEIAELLITNGADVNAKDVFGDTPLDQAIQFMQKETADLLRKHGGKTGEELKGLE